MDNVAARLRMKTRKRPSNKAFNQAIAGSGINTAALIIGVSSSTSSIGVPNVNSTTVHSDNTSAVFTVGESGQVQTLASIKKKENSQK